MPKKTYSALPADIRRFITKHLKFDVDIIRHIGDTFDSGHQKIATDIFWRLQQGESLNKMEVAHARLNSPVRNFLVKYADDYDFDHASYTAIDPNPNKHIFFRETYTRTNSRMQHLTMLGRFLLLELADGPARIGDNVIAALIDESRQDDGIGNSSFEDDHEAKSTLKMLHQLRNVFKDDPMLDKDWVGVLIFKDAYFIVSFYLLLRHLLQHYVYTDEIRLCFRDFAYKFFERTKYLSASDVSARNFTENNQQDETRIAVRDRIVRYEFFSYADSRGVEIRDKDERRAFSESQRIAIFLKDDGICQDCLAEGLSEREARVSWSEFEADHVLPHSNGGRRLLTTGKSSAARTTERKAPAMSDDSITLQLDGEAITVPRGATLLDAAQAAGIDIPVICYHEATSPNGLCRICVVDVDGGRVLQPACVAECQADTQVETRNERVTRSRRTILEMLNASVNLEQAPEIQQMMADYEADDARFPEAQMREAEVIDDNPFYVRDYEQCVLCWRCVQVCAEDAQYTFALTLKNRGHETSVATAFDIGMTESPCVFCGQCVGVCPTGALKPKVEWGMEQGWDADEMRRSTRRPRKRQNDARRGDS